LLFFTYIECNYSRNFTHDSRKIRGVSGFVRLFFLALRLSANTIVFCGKCACTEAVGAWHLRFKAMPYCSVIVLIRRMLVENANIRNN